MNGKLDQLLAETWFYRYLTSDEIEKLLKNSNVVQYNKRDVIFKQNTRTSHIMYVVSGLVKIYKTSRNNKSLSLSILSEGSFLSLFSIFGHDLFQCSASSVDSSQILMIDYATFASIIQQNGGFSLMLIKKLSQDGNYLTNRLMSLFHKQLPGRIAEVILYFSEQIYHKNEFEFPLTREELAELAGTTKESFIRTINEFKHDKIISLEGRFLRINSLDIIKVLSELG